MEKEKLKRILEMLGEAEEKEEKPNGDSKNKPLHRIQCGNVTASVFPCDYEKDGVTHATFNEWKSSKTFRVGDLHKVITVAQEAFKAVAVSNSETDG